MSKTEKHSAEIVVEPEASLLDWDAPFLSRNVEKIWLNLDNVDTLVAVDDLFSSAIKHKQY